MITSTVRRPVRRIALLAGLAALAAAFALPTAASADPAPTSVKLSENAQLTVPWEIDAQVTLNCTAGWGYSVFVNATQPQGWGFTLFGGGWAFGQCTGQQQKIAVALFPFGSGNWLLGDASATANACAGACAGDTKQIHIGL
jgi:hypothetical protein